MPHRAIVVDDSPQFLAALQEYLEALCGVAVIGSATNGEEALALLRTIQPDLMIVDMTMPGMNGLELAKRAHDEWPNLPIVVLTLVDSERHREAAFQAGARFFVAKDNLQAELAPALKAITARLN